MDRLRGAAVGAILAALSAAPAACGRIGYDVLAAVAPDSAATDAAVASTDAAFFDARDVAGVGPDAPDARNGAEDAPPSGDATGGCQRHAGALFCEDFENGLVTPRPDYGFAGSPNGVVRLDTSNPHAGRNAISLVAGDPSMGVRSTYFYKVLPSPASSGGLYARAFFYVPSGFVVTQYLVDLEFRNSGQEGVKVVHASRDRIDFVVTTDGFSVTSIDGRLPRDRWFCLEIGVQVASGNGGRAEYWIDGASQFMVPAARTLPPGGWTYLNFGIIADPMTLGSRMLVDDIVMSTQRVGCD